MAPAELLLVVVVTAAAALLLAAPASAALPRVLHAPKADGTLAVLAVGDWGRRGQFNQTLVAQQVKVKQGVNKSLQPRRIASMRQRLVYVLRMLMFLDRLS
jgi:hypothetical protein